MLSTKVQNDLITAYHKVYEEKRGHAAGSDDTEKQASQLASDVRYKAKGKVPEGASEEEKRKIFLQILSASPAPNVVKAMAKEKLLGEEVVNEVLGVVTATPKVMKKAQQVRARKNLVQNVKTKAKEYGEKAGRAIVGTTPKGKIVRAAAGGTVAYMMGRKDEAGANIDRNIKFGSLKKAGFVPTTKIEPLSSKAVKYEEAMLEDKKMSKQSDDDLAAAHKKFSGMDQSTPSNKFMLKRIEKEMKKRKNVKEEKAPRMQKGAMAYDGPNKERSEAADRILAKAKKKREKMKEEYVGEMKVKQVVKPKPARNPQNMALPKGVKSGVNYQNMAQSYVPVGNIFNEKKMDPVGAEDKDIDNDGDHDSTDKYLLKRRKAIGKAIAKKRGRVKEGFSAWRIDLDFNEQVKK